MKTLEVYVRKEWIDQNTSRQRYRALTYQDPLSMLTKSAKAIPAIGLAGAGMGKNLANQSLSLSNYGLHTLKEVHNGIANVGKNEDCRFNTPVDMSGQKELKKQLICMGLYPFQRFLLLLMIMYRKIFWIGV